VRGRFSCVNTLITPGTARAADESTAVTRPRVIALDTTTPWTRSGALNSAAYFAAPVTLAGPSTRLCAVPT
jgi:hypothetical protein